MKSICKTQCRNLIIGNRYGAYLNASLGKVHEYYRLVDFLFELINGPSRWSFVVYQTLVHRVYGILVGQFIYGMRDCFNKTQKGKVRNGRLFL